MKDIWRPSQGGKNEANADFTSQEAKVRAVEQSNAKNCSDKPAVEVTSSLELPLTTLSCPWTTLLRSGRHLARDSLKSTLMGSSLVNREKVRELWVEIRVVASDFLMYNRQRFQGAEFGEAYLCFEMCMGYGLHEDHRRRRLFQSHFEAAVQELS
ncbi:hypothetical protein Cgig2_015743 [Carnegiea gigantea]|uniref:Uncharacterized protein n=1 Tax=Carnegiea gigantea TaxID=171969 RepID=A0A9Q1Q4J6_9CARY|nr:hypothetical protein Cgig2_015743 [Carnegiea gigantea]